MKQSHFYHKERKFWWVAGQHQPTRVLWGQIDFTALTVTSRYSSLSMSVCMCVSTRTGAHACTSVYIWRSEDNSQSCFLGAISILPLLKAGSLNTLELTMQARLALTS